MGTNYYRIPSADEVKKKRDILVVQVETMELNPSDVEGGFRFISPNKDWEWFSPWDVFMKDMNVHLGKRSMGWKFCWNFHDNKYYSNKEELIEFIKSGRVVDEYGEEMLVDEFLEMSFNWGEPDGWVLDENYRKKKRMEGGGSYFFDDPKYDDKIIDGLRVSSSTEFS
jgi:hypothetical protein